ncbi:MAG: hypothetical protein ABR905_13465 [Terracidiphilus sp.]
MKRTVFWLIVNSCILVSGAGPASACSCTQRPTCGLARYGDVDFIGEVLSGHLVDDDGLTGAGADSRMTHPQQVLVEIRVIESFRGPQKAGTIIHLRTGLGGGDCGYRFKLGGKFLIDAMGIRGNLYTGICSLTAPDEEVGSEIETLRELAAGQRMPDVDGFLYKVNASSVDPKKKPLQGISISLMAKAGQALYQTSSDSQGRFIFIEIPGGTYTVSLGLPDDLSPAFTNFGRTTDQDEMPNLVVPSGGLGGANCHVEMYVDSAASISGVVKSPGNTSLDGWVNADNVKPGGTPWDTVLSSVPSPNGVFRLAHLPPGRYQIQFTSRAGFVKGDPQIVELRDGERKSGIVLTAK